MNTTGNLGLDVLADAIAERVLARMRQTHEKLTVLSATCSHLGCLVNYSKEKGEFLCPCHGGRYDLSGKNIAGPPPAPLGRIPAKIKNGMVLVGIKV